MVQVFTSCSLTRSYSTTETSLVKVTSNFYVVKPNESNSVLIKLDLSGASDTGDHFLLLEALFFLGFNGDTLSWFSFYFFNFLFSVSLAGCSSFWLLRVGVSQGLVLKQLLVSF